MTTKSFTLSKEMRQDVADKLTVMAIKDRMLSLEKLFKKANERFWSSHANSLSSIMQIDPARYPELIVAGCVAAVSVVNPTTESGKLFSEVHLRDSSEEGQIWRLIRRSADLSFINSYMRTTRYGASAALSFSSDTGSVPRLSGMEIIQDKDLLKIIEKLNDELLSITSAAISFRQKALSILASCRTSGQLTKLFPEAAKLLPQPVKSSNELAPVELVSSVQEMLKKGIPEKK